MPLTVDPQGHIYHNEKHVSHAEAKALVERYKGKVRDTEEVIKLSERIQDERRASESKPEDTSAAPAAPAAPAPAPAPQAPAAEAPAPAPATPQPIFTPPTIPGSDAQPQPAAAPAPAPQPSVLP